jgi:mRNA-degrading endonuclease toxin of MazEF toxin-antitoxin module
VRFEPDSRHVTSRGAPVVILQIDRVNVVSQHTIIAPFTTKIRQALLPSHASVPAGAGGLSLDSVIWKKNTLWR